MLVLQLRQAHTPFFFHVNRNCIEQLIRPLMTVSGERTQCQVDAIHRRSAHQAYNPVRFFHILRALQK
jgi:hypothetical protein